MKIVKTIGIALILIGVSVFVLQAILPLAFLSSWIKVILVFVSIGIGAFLLFASRYLFRPAGIDNDHLYQKGTSNRGPVAFLVGVVFTFFYVVIYFGDRWANVSDFFAHYFYSFLDPLAYALAGTPSSNWFFYGSMYTYAVLLFGMRMLLKYRHNRYQIFRTISVMFFQFGFAYILPNFLKLFQHPEFYFTYFWPLKAEYFYPQTWMNTYGSGTYFLCFSVFMSFMATPILTYLYGKRWYCSWVCGCGGLAETMGDPFRQHSDKSLNAWKLERLLVHSILVCIVLVTALLWVNSLSGGAIFASYSHSLSSAYGFFIGAIFSGVVGVGFYPILGTRVWCRFGCPMAAILGLLQKFFSRFRITTNGGQCISCGNCSTYCEMGIDVRWYAQRGQNVIRSSCVGCGICASVCPRGVLKLENASPTLRYNGPDPTILR